MNKARVWIAFWLLALVWGSSFLFIKIALDDLTAFTLVSMRVGIGATGLLIIIVATGRKIPTDRQTLINLVIVGLLNTAIPFVLITWGENFIDSGVAGMLNGTVPLFSLVIAHFAVADDRFNMLKLIGLLMGFVGLVLIFSKDGLDNLLAFTPAAFKGQLAVLGAAICYAFAAVFIRHNMRHVEPVTMAGVAQVVAFFAVLIGAFALEQPLQSQLSSRTLFAVTWLGLLGVTVAYILYFYILSQWEATRSTLITYALPPTALILGAVVLDETITWHLFVGGALILGGIAVVNRQAQAAPAVASGESAA